MQRRVRWTETSIEQFAAATSSWGSGEHTNLEMWLNNHLNKNERIVQVIPVGHRLCVITEELGLGPKGYGLP